MSMIINYSTFPGGNASEYIIPKSNISITSHGMGSGIYGLTQGRETDNFSMDYTFTIEKPFTINTDEECDEYISSSMELMRSIEECVSGKSDLYQPDFFDISQQFIKKTIFKKFELFTTIQALKNFWYDYNNRSDVVEMPINYILKSKGYDGVLSSDKTTCDSWSKGNVKFIPYPTYKTGDTLPVAIIIGRSGIDRYVIDLRKNGYVKTNSNEWVKQPEKAPVNCRYCFSLDHKSFNCPDKEKILENKYK